MDVDRGFEAFLRAWTEQRIWSVDDFLGDADQHFLAEKRATELIAVASERGFGEALAAAVKPYGGVSLAFLQCRSRLLARVRHGGRLQIGLPTGVKLPLRRPQQTEPGEA